MTTERPDADAVERLAALIEAHLSGLSPEEQTKRLAAFDQVVARVLARREQPSR
jgi:hypothetical protein